jgi:DedD protein
MATTSSNEAAEIRRRGRHRLIGAIVIAILLVVFVPMILDSEPRPKQDTPALEIPAKDTPMPRATPPKAEPAPAKTTSTAPPAEAPKAAAEAPKVAAVAPRKAEPAPAPVPAPKLEGFAVQVGAFKDEDKLQEARKKLAFSGISHYVERRDTPSGPLNRLRAGPYPTREAAEKALAQVKAAQLDGQVVPLP